MTTQSFNRHARLCKAAKQGRENQGIRSFLDIEKDFIRSLIDQEKFCKPTPKGHSFKQFLILQAFREKFPKSTRSDDGVKRIVYRVAKDKENEEAHTNA